MDTILEQISNRRVRSGMARLQAMLYEQRRGSTADEWRRFVKDEALLTPLRDREASVRSILANRTRIPGCDLAYTAGLYDYLPDAAATALTTLMFSSLRPGGTLLVANFLPDIIDVGYMESVMDWHLIYRSDEDMRRLMVDIPESDVEEVDQFHDPFDNVTFL